MATRTLLTGGSGRLGRELKERLPDLLCPTSKELDITCPDSISAALERLQPQLIVHAAAYTDVAGAESDRQLCWQVNVAGTRNLVRAAWERKLAFIHISTDYVFFGDAGMYREGDPPGPTRNYYALSKLTAEEVVRVLEHHLVIRTSFRPRAWPYPVAFDDLFTSQDYVDVIAPDIALAIERLNEIPFSTLHIATERKSVYDLARKRKADVRRGSKVGAGVSLPDDISLDITRWRELKAGWSQ